MNSRNSLDHLVDAHRKRSSHNLSVRFRFLGNIAAGSSNPIGLRTANKNDRARASLGHLTGKAPT